MECGFIDDSYGCIKLIFKFWKEVIVEYLLGSCMLQQFVPVTF
jgi:hypothetical protein